MIEKTFIAGFGGQGIISMGQIWAYFAVQEGYEITFYPYYGAEKRGGIARASVIVSDTEILSPLVNIAHSCVVMNQDSLAICEACAGEDSLLLYNSNLITVKEKKPHLNYCAIPCNDLALQCGDIRAANMVMLGALSEKTHALSLKDPRGVLSGFFPVSKHDLLDLNVKAIDAGKASVR